MHRTLAWATAALLGAGAALVSAGNAFATASAEPPLTDYIGAYAGTEPSGLEIVAGRGLFAVIDEAKYTLQPAGGDEFVARSGDRVRFTRDAAGLVNGYVLRGTHYPRRSTRPSAESADLAWPWPARPGFDNVYRYTPPPALGDGIATGDAAKSALAPAVLERVVQGVLDGTWPDVHSVLVYHQGRLLLEEYFYGYRAERPHQMRSATKSVVSALAGIAAGRPGGPALTSPVLARLPYSAYGNPDPRKEQITLEQLLTMRSGLACDDHDARSPGNESRLYETPDWVKATLDLPLLRNPGEQALYCSGGVAVAGRITERAVGQSLPDFAQEALFAPLGIARTHWRWNYDLSHRNREYSQIHLRPRDLLKFGLLFAQGGEWAGQQVVPAAWVQASLTPQTNIKGTGYSYFWWQPYLNVATPEGTRRVDYSSVQGNGGQKVYLMPQHSLVVVFTGGDYNSGASPPNRIMSTLILPALLAPGASASTPPR
jgi:CubicO group peptidase (beta-lactamase class C family)